MKLDTERRSAGRHCFAYIVANRVTMQADADKRQEGVAPIAEAWITLRSIAC